VSREERQNFPLIAELHLRDSRSPLRSCPDDLTHRSVPLRSAAGPDLRGKEAKALGLQVLILSIWLLSKLTKTSIVKNFHFLSVKFIRLLSLFACESCDKFGELMTLIHNLVVFNWHETRCANFWTEYSN